MPNYIAIFCVFCYNIEEERTLNIVIHVRSFGLSQELSELVHHVCFMLHKRMSIAVERNGRILMTENFRERFHIHTAFESAGGKRMPQRMKTLMRNV